MFFAVELARTLFWFFLFGGLPVLLIHGYFWFADRYEGYKKAEYSKTQKFVVLRVFPPAQNMVSMHSMEDFFNSVWSIYRERTPFKLFTLGRSYENLIIEFHSRGGFVGIFIRVNRGNMDAVSGQLMDRFPGTRVVEVADPMQSLPKTWDRKGQYTQMYATDMKVLEVGTNKENDLFTLKSWKEFQSDRKEPVSDPVVQLFGVLRDIDPRAYVILQFILRPMYNKKKLKDWMIEFQSRKKELLGEKDLDLGKRQKIITNTPTQSKILNDITRKINSLNYLCKIRIVAMGQEGVDMATIKHMIWSYFNQYSSEMGRLRPQKDTQSTAESKGDFLGMLGPQMGLFADKAFYEKERYFREKMVYDGLVRRNIDVGSAYYYLDTQALAAMIHFPYITPEQKEKRNIQAKTEPEVNERYQYLFKSQPPESLPE